LEAQREIILAYLSEPRQAKEAATHIDRPVPDATGHLAAMRRSRRHVVRSLSTRRTDGHEQANRSAGPRWGLGGL